MKLTDEEKKVVKAYRKKQKREDQDLSLSRGKRLSNGCPYGEGSYDGQIIGRATGYDWCWCLNERTWVALSTPGR